jgi:hypothetical protein
MAQDMSDRAPESRHFAAEDHAAEAPIKARAALATSRSAPRRETSPHAHKFRIATAALVGIAIVAVAVAIAAGTNKSATAQSAQWSEWSPPDGGSLGAREIADHIAPLYRISSVDQLAVVTVVNLSDPNNPLKVAVRSDPTSSSVSVLSGSTIAYNLCGIGASNCAIGVGQPSADRLLLLRREALELAMYTLKYIPGTQNVVAILPPGHTTTTSTLTSRPPTANSSATTKPLNMALLFVKPELQPFLSQPLAAILPEQFPPTVAQMRAAPEAGLVDQITARGLFSQSLVQAQDGSTLIMLDPLPPQ